MAAANLQAASGGLIFYDARLRDALLGQLCGNVPDRRFSTRSSGNQAAVSARRVVVALGAVELIAWLLALGGAGGKVPTAPFVVVDIAIEALLLVGLWFLWRVAWWIAVAGTVAGELFGILRVSAWSGRDAVLVAVGIVQLMLLMLPQLRASLRPLRRSLAA